MSIINRFVSKYPYTDFHEMNLDWLLAQMLQLRTDMKDFVNLNTIKYADPIQWNITTQYQGNTVVIEPVSGDAYLSTQPVPAGVAITDTDYWTVIGSFGSVFSDIKESIAAADEGPSTVASANRAVDDLVWLSDKLYVVTAPIATGESYAPGTNCEQITVEMLLKKESEERASADTLINASILNMAGQIGNIATSLEAETEARINADTVINGSILNLAGQIENIEASEIKYRPESYGAKGDGITDDTAAFQACIDDALENHGMVFATNVYKITAPLVIDSVESLSTDNAKPYIFFNKIIYEGNAQALTVTGYHIRIVGNLIKSSYHGISLGNGSKGCQVTYIDIKEIDSERSGYILRPSTDDNVQYIYINNGNIYHGQHGADFDLTNRYIGEIFFNNIIFSVKGNSQTAGSAIYMHDWNGHRMTGLYLNNVSFEGAYTQDGIELVNVSLARPILPLVMHGIRYSEARGSGSKLITATVSDGISPLVDAEIEVDEIDASSIHIPRCVGNLEVRGLFVETGCTHSVYSSTLDKVIPYPIVYEAAYYTGTATRFPYTELVRLTGDCTFPLRNNYIGTQIMYTAAAVTVTLQTPSGNITKSLPANTAIILKSAHVKEVGMRFIISDPIPFSMLTPLT